MVDPVNELLKQGGGYFLAAIFLYVWLQERKEHREDNKTNATTIGVLQEGRISDMKTNYTEVTRPMADMSESLRIINEKLLVSKGRR